jgi:hypothetical protein
VHIPSGSRSRSASNQLRNDPTQNGRLRFWFDTETTTDPTQRLLFGSYRYCRRKEGFLHSVEEGLFHADELPIGDPAAFVVLQNYVGDHPADVVHGADRRLLLMSRSEFVKKKLFPVAYDVRGLIVGFNLPFDLARVAVDWKEARRFYEGGFSLVLNDYEDKKGARSEDIYVPRLRLKHIDSKRALLGFARPPRIDKLRDPKDLLRRLFR